MEIIENHYSLIFTGKLSDSYDKEGSTELFESLNLDSFNLTERAHSSGEIIQNNLTNSEAIKLWEQMKLHGIGCKVINMKLANKTNSSSLLKTTSSDLKSIFNLSNKVKIVASLTVCIVFIGGGITGYFYNGNKLVNKLNELTTVCRSIDTFVESSMIARVNNISREQQKQIILEAGNMEFMTHAVDAIYTAELSINPTDSEVKNVSSLLKGLLGNECKKVIINYINNQL